MAHSCAIVANSGAIVANSGSIEEKGLNPELGAFNIKKSDFSEHTELQRSGPPPQILPKR